MVVASEAPYRLFLSFLRGEDVALAGYCLAYVLSFHQIAALEYYLEIRGSGCWCSDTLYGKDID